MAEFNLAGHLALPLSLRKDMVYRILNIHREKVPIIISVRSRDFKLSKYQFIISRTWDFIAFRQLVMNRLVNDKADASQKSYFFYVNHHQVRLDELIGSLYDNHKNEDGFLYLEVVSENTFG